MDGYGDDDLGVDGALDEAEDERPSGVVLVGSGCGGGRGTNFRGFWREAWWSGKVGMRMAGPSWVGSVGDISREMVMGCWPM